MSTRWRESFTLKCPRSQKLTDHTGFPKAHTTKQYINVYKRKYQELQTYYCLLGQRLPQAHHNQLQFRPTTNNDGQLETQDLNKFEAFSVILSC